MAFVFNRLVLLSIAAAAAANNFAAAADKDAPQFRARPADSYVAHQTNARVTIGAEPFADEEKAKTAFGKNNPYRFGVLPVLVVIQNDTAKAVRTDNLKLEYIAPDRSRVEATPASEVRYLRGPNRPSVITGPTGAPTIGKSKKNPLNAWEIEGRAFAAKMIPPGQSASGFFYFHTGFQRGSKLYLTGITEADTGKELFYYELPFE